MEQQDRGHAVAVDAPEGLLLPFAHAHEPQDQQTEQHEDEGCAEESPLFADGAEDEVGVFFGDESVFDLGSLQEALSGESAGTDGDFGLIDVVIEVAGVVEQPEVTFDAVLLVFLEDRVEDIVGRGEEDHRSGEEPDEDEDVAQIGAVCVCGGPDHREEADDQQAVVQVELPGGDDCGGRAEENAAQGDAGQEDDPRFPESVHHGLGEYADQDDRYEQGHGREQERDDEQGGDQQHGDAEPLVEPLAVEDEEERPEDDSRSGVVLQDDDQQRDADYDGDFGEVPGAVDREGVPAHDAGQCECRCDLGELHGLHAHGPEFEPGLCSVDLASEEQGGDEESEAGEIGRVGEHVVESVVEQQHDEGGDPGESDPDELLHVEVREGEGPADGVVVGGRDDGDESGQYEEDVEEDGSAVDAVEYAVEPVTCHRRGSGFACS